MSDFNWDEYPEVNESKSAFNWDEYPVVEPEATAVDIAKRFGQNALGGFAQMGHGLINLPHNLVNLVSEEAAQHIPRQQEYDFAALLGQEKKEPVDLLTQGIFQYGPSLGIPAANLGRAGKAIESVPKVGKYLEKMLGLAAPQAAYTYAQELEQNPENAMDAALQTAMFTAPFGAVGQAARSTNPWIRNTGKGLGIGGSAAGGYFLGDQIGLPGWISALLGSGAGLLTQRSLAPKTYAQKNVFEGVSPEATRPVVEAAERLGLSHITPAEAMGDQFSAARQASIGRTPEASKLKFEQGQQRLASEEKAINNFFDDIYTDKLDPVKEDFYQKALSTPVDNAFASQKIGESQLISRAVKKLETDPAFIDRIKREKIQRGSLGYWDEVKKVLSGMEETAMRGKSPDKNKADIIGDVRRDLVSELDALYPDYKRARALGQRDIIRNKLENNFDRKDLTGLNFYRSILTSDKDFGKLVDDLSEFPDIQRQLHDMRLVFPRLLNVPTARTVHGQEATSMNKTRGGWQQSLEELIANSFGARADVESVKLMTDPKWLSKLIKDSGADKKDPMLAKIAELLGKGTGQIMGANYEKK